MFQCKKQCEKQWQLFFFILFGILFLSACSDSQQASQEQTQTLRLLTTTSTVGSGLMDVLIPAFEKKYDIKVKVVSKGTGAVLKLAREGLGDVILVHAREEEDKFVMDAFGVNRKDVMYNDFIILGPIEDPFNIKQSNDVLVALKTIADQKGQFISRNDNSGNHIRERSLWKLASIEPKSDWYNKENQGMVNALKFASEKKAYIMSDRSTYLHNKDILQLTIVLEGDKRLFNPYGVIAINPATVRDVHFFEAMKFIDYITSREGQEIIAQYGKTKFGAPLFTPMAIK